MDQIPASLLCKIVEFLNPKERQWFAGMNREHRHLFPSPLRLRIASKSSGSALQETFFVSPRSDPHKMLLDWEELIFEEDYLFWAYDYERENKVYLSRHGQKRLDTENTRHIFTLGLRPKIPTQFVRVRGGEAGTKVQFEEFVGLDIGGNSPMEHTPDSKARMFLSSQTLTVGASWYCIQRKWGNDEKLQLFRCQDYVCSNDDHTNKLIVHAIADISDGPCHLYSPNSLKDGRAACELYHANVKFYLWVLGGLLCFQGLGSLPFAFGIPLLEEDNLTDMDDPMDSLKSLFERNSSRWWAVKLYLATAADHQTGKRGKMETFMRYVKGHRDHTITWDESRNLVYVQVKDAILETRIADRPKKEDEIWEVLIEGS